MPQDMNVLCCYSCKMYQVHIVKKARKWQCKLCNAKQSIQQVYFQGSGKDCRLHVQHMNYLKANDTSQFPLYAEQENSDSTDSCNASSIAQESDIGKPVESTWAKYLDSPGKESLSDAEGSSSNIHEIEDTIANEKSPCITVNNDSCNFEGTVDDRNFGNEDIADETEELCSTSLNYNYTINEDKRSSQDSGKSDRDHNNIENIFETYSELDDPIDI